MSIRIVVGEDLRMIRELLVALLSRDGEFSVAGEASSGRDTISLAREARPDVLILDIGLPDVDGIEVTRTLRAEQPLLKIIALSIHSDERFVRQMLKAGADGYVVKSAAVTELVHAIRAVTQDRMYLSPAIARQAMGRRSATQPGTAARLSQREQQVLGLIADGLRSPEIARRLGISAATVDAHRRNIMRKLNLHTIAELTKYAVREGLASLDERSRPDD